MFSASGRQIIEHGDFVKHVRQELKTELAKNAFVSAFASNAKGCDK